MDELEGAEEVLKQAFIPYICRLFEKFHDHKDIWNSVLSIVAELDCFSSLSIVSG